MCNHFLSHIPVYPCLNGTLFCIYCAGGLGLLLFVSGLCIFYCRSQVVLIHLAISPEYPVTPLLPSSLPPSLPSPAFLPRSHRIAQTDLEFRILQSHPLESLDYSQAPPCGFCRELKRPSLFARKVFPPTQILSASRSEA